MNAAATLTGELPQEERQQVDAEEGYRRLLARLSHQSVVKHYDAYADIPWDDPDFAIDPADPRLQLSTADPLGATAWYQSQPAEVRSRIGLHMIATFAQIGWRFESVLKRGLLEFALKLPTDAPEFRYCYHEVIEEAQHSLFFHEFVARTGLDVRSPRILGVADRQVVGFGRHFPELFFFFVLAGEDPIDHVQREMLQNGRALHPLIERITRIHITEEARHMAFARHYLRRTVPKLRGYKWFALRLRTAVVMKIASLMMSRPSGHVVRTYGIPAEVLREAYGKGSRAEQNLKRALFKPRELCWELGVLTPRWAWLWKRLGIYAAQGSPV
ncbi:MAG: AurF N-oxygenase family protein [Candidatus Binatia bacterium]